ncbi:MAG: hypothetical protein ACYTG6_11565 [Planctomycetota bacterium]|jgi:hypothetical protein
MTSDAGHEITRGEKIDAEEVVTLDRNKMAVGTPRPPSGDVEAQSGFDYIICPWDEAVNYVYVDHHHYNGYTCWSCGMAFRA